MYIPTLYVPRVNCTEKNGAEITTGTSDDDDDDGNETKNARNVDKNDSVIRCVVGTETRFLIDKNGTHEP